METERESPSERAAVTRRFFWPGLVVASAVHWAYLVLKWFPGDGSRPTRATIAYSDGIAVLAGQAVFVLLLVAALAVGRASAFALLRIVSCCLLVFVFLVTATFGGVAGACREGICVVPALERFGVLALIAASGLEGNLVERFASAC